MRKFLLSIFIFVFSFSLLPTAVSAAGENDSLLADVAKDGFNVSADNIDGIDQEVILYVKIGEGVQVVLRFVGVIIFILVLYAGFLWMTAGGNTAQVEQAKKILTNGIIGLVLISVANLLVGFIVASVFTNR